MKKFLIATVLAGGAWLSFSLQSAQAAPCLLVTITGAMGGPPNFNGMAGPGTLVRYGDDSSGCGAVKIQFDAGRATNC